jgi:hypothetical protein
MEDIKLSMEEENMRMTECNIYFLINLFINKNIGNILFIFKLRNGMRVLRCILESDKGDF